MIHNGGRFNLLAAQWEREARWPGATSDVLVERLEGCLGQALHGRQFGRARNQLAAGGQIAAASAGRPACLRAAAAERARLHGRPARSLAGQICIRALICVTNRPHTPCKPAERHLSARN